MDKKPEMSEKRRPARDAILAAFRDIVLDTGYDGVRVLDVVQRSGVARSTFYEHFASREDLLRDSMRGPMHLLAQLASPLPDEAKAAFILEHFVENRDLAQGLLDGQGAKFVRRLLAELIADASPRAQEYAHAIAGAQLAMIAAWFTGEDACSAAALAHKLCAVTRALLA